MLLVRIPLMGWELSVGKSCFGIDLCSLNTKLQDRNQMLKCYFMYAVCSSTRHLATEAVML
jgi:hypothetical protein